MARGRKPMFDGESIRRLVEESNLSDYQIAEIIGASRSTVSHYRRILSDVNKINKCGRVGEIEAINQILKLGLDCIDMNINDKRSEFDILVNQKIRVEVKASQCNGNSWKFVFSHRAVNIHNKAGKYEQTTSTRYVKDVKRFSDFVVLVAFDGNEKHFFVIPVKEFKDKIQTVNIPKKMNGKWSKFLNRFDLLMEG